MKKLNLFTLMIAGLLAFASCEEANVGPKLNTSVEPPSFTSSLSGQSFVLTEDNADEVAMELSWREPGLGFKTEVNYTVEMAESGTDFADPKTLIQTTATSASMTVGELNNQMLASGFPSNVENNIDMRIKTVVNDDVEDMYSDPMSIMVTPYYVDVSYPQIYVPGSYQSASGYTADWSPSDAPPLFSANSDDVYEGYVYMANGSNQFKFTPERTWDADWGDSGADGTLDPGGTNIELADAGYYKMNVDINDLTYTVTNTTWGLIGSATPDGWDSDQDMTYDPVEKVWTITLTLTAGEMKFRANNAWDLDYGDNEGDGFLEQGGGNIQVASGGTYTVTLDLSDYPYSYSVE